MRRSFRRNGERNTGTTLRRTHLICQAPAMRLLTAALCTIVIAGCSEGTESASTSPTGAASSTETTTNLASTTSTTDTPTTTIAPTTTIDLAALATAYAEPGPFTVGVRTVTLAKGNSVEIWYPTTDAASTDDYDVRDFVPPAIRDVLTADVPATYTSPARRDASVDTGPFPVVLFSHGFTGMRVQSTFLTAHLASWGMIVASPDHPSRDMFNVLSGTASGDRADSVDDLLQTLDYLVTQNGDATSPFAGRVDAEQVVAVGHSAGGGTVLGAAADDRIDGYVSMASGRLDGAAQPAKPSFYLAGANDVVVDPATRTYPAYQSAPSPSLYWQIDGVGHNGFDDFCTFGNGTGIIGVADASGLGALLDTMPDLRRLGEDGCLPPNAPVDDTFPIVRHAVTAWALDLFGKADALLDDSIADAYAMAVRIESR
jgi:dienelactone hydrolase